MDILGQLKGMLAEGDGKLSNKRVITLLSTIMLVIGGIALIAVLGLLFSLPVMWLWNAALVPAIPGIKTIGWLQAWGILILSGLLFKPTVSSKD